VQGNVLVNVWKSGESTNVKQPTMFVRGTVPSKITVLSYIL
jgi:hypothetical protein